MTAMRNEAEARLKLANSNLERMEQLREKDVLTDVEFEQAAMEVATTQAMLESAEAQLSTTTAGPTSEEIAVQEALVAQAEVEVEQAQVNIDKATIHAPYDGIVVSIDAEVGDRVSAANGPLVEVMDLRYLVAEIGVPEAYIGRVNVHDEAQVTLAGFADPVPGIVIAVNAYVDPAARTFQARIAIDNEQLNFKAGQFANVRLHLELDRDPLLMVPNESIVFVEGEPHVFRVEAGQARLIAVELGLADELSTEVVNGLNDEDQIVTDDPSLLVDGMHVVVRTEQETVAARETTNTSSL